MQKQTVFSNISFSANEGDIIGITGRNGAGKSTLCNCLCGLLKAKEGKIVYKGKKLSERARTKLFGMVMQEENYILLVVTHDYEFLNRTCDGYIQIESRIMLPE